MFSTNSHRRPSGVHGFLLLEALLGLVILAVALMGAMNVIRSCQRVGAEGINLSQAVTIAQAELERAATLPGDALDPATGAHGRFNWTLSFETRPESLMLAIVEVTWVERGEARGFRIERLFWPLPDATTEAES